MTGPASMRSLGVSAPLSLDPFFSAVAVPSPGKEYSV